jgi:hypothetical protein
MLVGPIVAILPSESVTVKCRRALRTTPTNSTSPQLARAIAADSRDWLFPRPQGAPWPGPHTHEVCAGQALAGGARAAPPLEPSRGYRNMRLRPNVDGLKLLTWRKRSDVDIPGLNDWWIRVNCLPPRDTIATETIGQPQQQQHRASAVSRIHLRHRRFRSRWTFFAGVSTTSVVAASPGEIGVGSCESFSLDTVDVLPGVSYHQGYRIPLFVRSRVAWQISPLPAARRAAYPG